MARKEKIFHYIYKTTNLLNGRYYYGMHSTDNLEDGYLGSGKRLRYSVNKHGAENHEVKILEFLPDRIKLAKREKEIVNLNEIAKEDCMNLMVGGEGGYVFISKEESIRRATNAGNASACKMYGDLEYREKQILKSSETMKKTHSLGKIKYDTFTNRKHSKETKELMSLKAKKHIGNLNSQFGTCWITNGIEIKKIKKIEIEKYLNCGWKCGRKIN